MRSERISQQIAILKNVKELIRDKKLKITDTLLGLLDKVGVNLQGYNKSVPLKNTERVQEITESNKKMVLKDVA